jgi:zinc transporter, ZIP family
VIAVGMGLQNFTEGLVFGSAWAAAEIGLLAVVFVGFLLQNITEGFPIASPYLGSSEKPMGLLVTLFLVGGLPTIFGGVLGYFYNSSTLDLVFDGAAIGAIAYVLLPMMKAAFRPSDTPEKTAERQRLLYLGVLAGFVLGFVVNAI